MLRWKVNILVAAWNRYREMVDESLQNRRVGERVVLFWANQLQGRSFRTWEATTKEAERQRRVMERAVGRMRHRGMSEALDLWCLAVDHRRQSIAKALLDETREQRLTAMQDQVSELEQLFEATAKNVTRRAADAVAGKLSGAQEVIQEQSNQLKQRHDRHVQRMVSRVLHRMQHRAAFMVFEGWRDAHARELRRRTLVTGALRRWRLS